MAFPTASDTLCHSDLIIHIYSLFLVIASTEGQAFQNATTKACRMCWSPRATSWGQTATQQDSRVCCPPRLNGIIVEGGHKAQGWGRVGMRSRKWYVLPGESRGSQSNACMHACVVYVAISWPTLPPSYVTVKVCRVLSSHLLWRGSTLWFGALALFSVGL